MTTPDADGLDADLFRIIVYLVSSASSMPEFTLELASLMQLDAVERIIAMAQRSPAFRDDPFLDRIRAECGVHKEEVMHDPAAFRNWISDLEGRVVVEARRRNSAAG
jgi:hypothetical protein